MKYKIRKNHKLSGNITGVYHVYINDDHESLFDRFLNENISSYKNELKDIVQRLNTIANETGAREQFFKTKEGKPGDHIEALYDKPKSNLRLFCIRFGQQLLILGGGGVKPKSMRTWQESEKLTTENLMLQELSDKIGEALKEGTIKFSDDYKAFEGTLTFKDDKL